MNKFFMLCCVLLVSACSQKSQEVRIVVGTSTQDQSKGIYIYDFNEDELTAKLLSTMELKDPTFLTMSEDNRFFYSVSELDSASSTVNSFKYDEESVTLTPISTEHCLGAFPCHITYGNGWIATANYGGGSISVFPIDSNGAIKPMSQLLQFNTYEEGENPSHLHCLIQSNDQKHLYATDLGKDRIYHFNISTPSEIESGRDILELTSATSIKQGSGPRHLTLADNGCAYLITELSGEVFAFKNDDYKLEVFQTAASDSVGGGGSADIHLSDDGKFLYASNRLKEDGISTFAVDPLTGKVEKVGYTKTGIHPRNFTLSPSGKYILVACRDSDAIEIYSRDTVTGQLTYTGKEFDIKLDAPMFVKFL